MLAPGLRPGNFENAIQNILYLFSVPPLGVVFSSTGILRFTRSHQIHTGIAVDDVVSHDGESEPCRATPDIEDALLESLPDSVRF